MRKAVKRTATIERGGDAAAAMRANRRVGAVNDGCHHGAVEGHVESETTEVMTSEKSGVHLSVRGVEQNQSRRACVDYPSSGDVLDQRRVSLLVGTGGENPQVRGRRRCDRVEGASDLH